VSKKRKQTLVALGSAAVLTVYAAGYLRTRSGTLRFADEGAGRRPPAAMMDAPAHAAPLPSTAAVAPKGPATKAATKPARKSAETSVAAALVPATDTSGTTSTAQGTDSAAQPVAADRAPYRDGVYLGWGSSRHGDIQASVEIRDGRIYAAAISQCLTRYSCSWISMLPEQVVARQSAETDVVSGATQSSDAFYYAVTEALKQAK
jgi:uncharacterized protein with FMN-binding domain